MKKISIIIFSLIITGCAVNKGVYSTKAYVDKNDSGSDACMTKLRITNNGSSTIKGSHLVDIYVLDSSGNQIAKGIAHIEANIQPGKYAESRAYEVSTGSDYKEICNNAKQFNYKARVY